jgi:chromosome partitioning protein
LAAISADKGLRTLVVDLDPQSNSTQYLLGRNAHNFTPTIADYFQNALNFRFNASHANQYVHATPFKNLFILPASPDQEFLLTKLDNRQKIYKLRSLLDKLTPAFDNIFIDTPPAMNFFTKSALIATDTCLIPFDCDQFSRNAIYHLFRGVSEVREKFNGQLRVEGVIVNQFQPSAALPQKLVNELLNEGLPVIPTFLSSSIVVKESHNVSLPLIHFAKNHKLTTEFMRVFQALQTNEITQPDAFRTAAFVEKIVEEVEI